MIISCIYKVVVVKLCIFEIVYKKGMFMDINECIYF